MIIQTQKWLWKYYLKIIMLCNKKQRMIWPFMGVTCVAVEKRKYGQHKSVYYKCERQDLHGNMWVKRAQELTDTDVRSVSGSNGVCEAFAEEEEEPPQLKTRLAVGDFSVLTPQLDDRTL